MKVIASRSPLLARDGTEGARYPSHATPHTRRLRRTSLRMMRSRRVPPLHLGLHAASLLRRAACPRDVAAGPHMLPVPSLARRPPGVGRCAPAAGASGRVAAPGPWLLGGPLSSAWSGCRGDGRWTTRPCDIPRPNPGEQVAVSSSPGAAGCAAPIGECWRPATPSSRHGPARPHAGLPPAKHASARCAPRRSAPARLASHREAMVTCAPHRFARCKSAPRNQAWMKLASHRSASGNVASRASVLSRFAPCRRAPVQSARSNFAPSSMAASRRAAASSALSRRASSKCRPERSMPRRSALRKSGPSRLHHSPVGPTDADSRMSPSPSGTGARTSWVASSHSTSARVSVIVRNG
jgi:hypothetical protein